jgi:hypothetical protein
MHILQWIATKAETADEAYDNVESQLQTILNDSPDWYDWYVVGGGRFNMTEDESFEGAYKEGKTNMIISSDNREAFDERVAKCIQYRVDEFNRYRDEWSNSAVSLSEYLDGYDGNIDYSFNLYPLGKMIDMVQGKWDYNSYFYDLEHWSTNPKHMQSDINDVGGVWYLVPVDFHF